MIKSPTKRKSILLLTFTLLLFLGGSGCKKVVITDTVYSDFIGNWSSIKGTDAYIELEIEENYAYWLKLEGIVTTNVEGIPKIIPKRDKLKINIKKFDIDSYPTLVDGEWQMVLDGVTYERY